MDAGSGLVRGLRAAVVSTLVVLLAVTAHATGGGHTSPVATVLLLLVIAPVSWIAVGRRLHARTLMALLGGAQLLVHVAMVALTASSPGGGVARQGHGAHSAGLVLGGSMPMPGHAAMRPQMLLAHLAITVVTALLLAHGERLLWQVVSRLMPVVARVHVPAACGTPLPAAPGPRLHARLVVLTTPTRGPPLRLA